MKTRILAAIWTVLVYFVLLASFLFQPFRKQ